MAAEKVKAFFEDPKVQEAIKGRSAPTSAENAVVLFAEVAGELGYDLTAEDFKALIPKSMEELKDRTDAVIEEIGELSDEDMSKVAGGAADQFGAAIGCIQSACSLTLIFDYWCDSQLIIPL